MIDAHAHLNEIEDLNAVLARARAAGVKRILAVGMEVDSNQKTLTLSRDYPETIYPAIGYHPWAIKNEEIEVNLTFIQKNLKDCLALGEVGLDYKAKVKKGVQREVFARLLRLAVENNKPVIIHTRFSYQRAFLMVRQAGLERAVFHWYSGDVGVLRDILAAGYFISATPALAYSPPHQEAVKAAPLEQILLETDAPVEYQGKVSEPAHLVFTAQEVSRLKKVDLSQVKAVTSANALRFLGLEKFSGTRAASRVPLLSSDPCPL